MHWFDAVDVLFDGETDSSQLRIALNCPLAEWSVYESHLAALATDYGLSFEANSRSSLQPDGCPDFMLKTTPDRVLDLAREVIIALAYNGVVHGYFPVNTIDPERRAAVTDIIQHFESSLADVGGDWQSRHVPRPIAIDVEADWLKVLEQEFSAV
jgi:hypothetical protein